MKPFLIILLLFPFFVEAQESIVHEQIINFATNEAKLSEADKATLKNLNSSLASQGTLSYRIYGHTDNVGSARSNKRLSLMRAEAVKKALVDGGVASGSVQYFGLSFDQPISDNASEDGRKMNRRVELKVFKVMDKPVKDEVIKPTITNATISGSVNSAKTGALAKAIVKFTSKGNVQTATTDANGKYSISLPSNITYDVSTEYAGHFGYNKSVPAYENITHDIILSPLEENTKIKISDLNFLSNKSTISPNSKSALDFMTQQLKSNALCYEVGGHVYAPSGSNASDPYFQDLSLARAVTVYDYFVSHGIDEVRITPVGFGITQPLIADAKTTADYLANMRVEVKILNCDKVKQLKAAEMKSNIDRVRNSPLFK